MHMGGLPDVKWMSFICIYAGTLLSCSRRMDVLKTIDSLVLA